MHFLDIAIGSSYEVESQIINSNDLKFINKEELNSILLELNEIQRMLVGFQKTLR